MWIHVLLPTVFLNFNRKEKVQIICLNFIYYPKVKSKANSI